MINILVVDDDAQFNQIICTYLNDSGYNTRGALNAHEAYDLMHSSLCDLIVSDIMMPEIDGFQFAEAVRGINNTVPILFVTARDDFASKQKGFRIGVDDYMVKPINMNELVLRVGALLRRTNIARENKLSVGGLVMNADEMTVTANGENISVTMREFNILFKMLSYPKKTFTRQQLMNEFWDVNSDTTLRAVDVYIVKLREKFSRCDDFKIVTVRGIGYKAVME